MVDTMVGGVDIRSAVPVGKNTVRTRITDLMLDVLDAAPFDEDEPDGAKLFDTVKRGNLEDVSMRETPGAALEEGDESVDEKIYEHTDKKLRMYVNFKVVRVQGIDPTDLINYYFARIVKLFVTVDRHFAGLALDIAEAGNSIQANGLSDPEPGGTVFLDVDYRHARGDLINE